MVTSGVFFFKQKTADDLRIRDWSSDVCSSDLPEEELRLTANAQPALMAASLAAVRVLESEGVLRLADRAAFVAGHSLGEYSALAAVGSLELADAARQIGRAEGGERVCQ